MKEATNCANCKKEGLHEQYAYDTRFGMAISHFCKDCWVIVYGEGKTVLPQA